MKKTILLILAVVVPSVVVYAFNPVTIPDGVNITNGSDAAIPVELKNTPASPAQTNNQSHCPDIANKLGTIVYSTPDAGYNCVLVQPNKRYRVYATVNTCAQVGAIPATCSTTAVSTGLRIPMDSPEDIPFMGTANLLPDGGSPPDGSTPTHMQLCGLPASSTGVLCLTPLTNCSATP